MHCSLVDVIEVEVLKNYELHLKFDDGSDGNIDISKVIPFKGIFAPLKDKSFFSRVTLRPEVGTICWENGADLSPSFLRENIRKE